MRSGFNPATARRHIAGLSVALPLLAGSPSAQAASSLGLDADECAIQYALLGQTAPGCPPPDPAPPPPVAPYQPPEPPLPPPRPQAANPAKPPTATAADVTREVEDRKASFLILFDTGSSKISGASETLLARIATVMKSPQAADVRFRVVGHTDAAGTPAKNLILSRQRAEAVVRHLVEKGGIPVSRLEAVGLGQAYLAEPQHPRAAANRRVEIIRLIKASVR